MDLRNIRAAKTPKAMIGAGILNTDYSTGEALSDVLQKRREKLALTKIGLQPDPPDIRAMVLK